jgi:hypothetical protein
MLLSICPQLVRRLKKSSRKKFHQEQGEEFQIEYKIEINPAKDRAEEVRSTNNESTKN